MKINPRVLLAFAFVSVCTRVCPAAPLAPNDPALADNLVSWHRNAASNYANGVWKAEVGKDLIALGDAEDESDFFEVPSLATWSPSEGYFRDLSEVDGVLFSADESDMLWAEGLVGGGEFETLTLIGVYQTTGNSDRTRPVGIGSWTESRGQNNFNLSSDASLRYDNGNNQTDPSLHLPDLTYRAGVLADGSVYDYLDGEVITEGEFPGGSFEAVTRNDNLYIGDVRGGLVDGFTSADPHDIFVSEVIVYNSMLTESQINDIGEWLRENLGASTGNPLDFDGDGSLGLGDINILRDQIQAGTNDTAFDLTGDARVDFEDLKEYVEGADKLNTFVGDSNLDGEFNSSDFVVVFTAGEYEDNVPNNSNWATGDWNGDGDFDSSDFVSAFTSGGYESGPRMNAASTVPEPSAGILLLIAGMTLLRHSRRQKA